MSVIPWIVLGVIIAWALEVSAYGILHLILKFKRPKWVYEEVEKVIVNLWDEYNNDRL